MYSIRKELLQRVRHGIRTLQDGHDNDNGTCFVDGSS
jgi:hypothetical protein